MTIFFDGFQSAFNLLVSLDPDVLDITWRTIQVSTVATFISVLIGIPIGTALALTRFQGGAFWSA